MTERQQSIDLMCWGPTEGQVSISHAEQLDIIKWNKQGFSLDKKKTHQLFWAEMQDFLIK